jgi:CubicO group peptidase (beta-lactamase class C family)
MSYQDVFNEIQNQISSGLIQGAVVCTSLNETPIACGIQSGSVPMSADSRFDIASVGKVFTAACVALLSLEGRIDLDAPFTEYLPDHVLGKECRITLRDLAAHASGFDNSKPYRQADHGEFMRQLYAMLPANPRRSTFVYSCANYILLGKVLNAVTGMDLDTLARRLIWGPLGMKKTTWNSPGPGKYEVQHHEPTRPGGEHNDEVCYLAAIPLGSGSLFSTAEDMVLFLRDIVEKKMFPAAYYDLITKEEFHYNGTIRSFGWDMTPAARPAGLSAGTIFHTGFTGQSIFADPGTGFYGAVLTSRTGNWAEAIKGRIRIVEKLLQET